MYSQQLAREAATPIDFNHYSRSAWHELQHETSSGSRDYEASFDISSAIEDMLDAIVAKTKPHSPYATKFSAVETFRKIYKSLLLSHGVVPHEVRKSCYGWGDKFLAVVGTFDEGGLERLRNQGNGEWMGKLDEIADLANDYCIDDSLGVPEARDIITGEAEVDEEDEEEEDEDWEGGRQDVDFPYDNDFRDDNKSE